MKTFLNVFLTGLLFLVFSNVAIATDYEYRPEYYNSNDRYEDDNKFDLGDLDHNSAYSWGIDLLADIDFTTHEITGFSLFFDNISNWDNTSNVLYVSLLNNNTNINPHVQEGVHRGGWYDDFNDPNYYLNKGKDNLLFRWNDLNTTDRDITVSITDDSSYDNELISTVNDDATLYIAAGGLSKINQYASSGLFGLGFDPDCHFWNDGITLKISTSKKIGPGNEVPEPNTMLLFGIGLLGLGALGRKKTIKNC